jgi:hypothetical protein
VSTYRDLTDSPADVDLLTRFYDTLYVGEFPDPDERESLANMVDYLGRKRRGWYGPNNYHILLAMDGDRPVGGSITDYLAEPDVGVIEFILVSSDARKSGTGRRLLARTEQLLDEDARRSLGRPLDAVAAEMNDPLAPSDVPDNLDPTTRALIWDHWGYAGLDFPYRQPALSPEQEPVTNLIMIAKPLRADWHDGLPASTVRLVVHEYLRWAMRIDRPEDCADYRTMADHLDGRPTVATIPLARYVGRDPERPLHVREIDGPDDPDFTATMVLYRDVFGTGGLAVPEASFLRALTCGGGYHLWSVRVAAGTGPVLGLVSFFSLRTVGFCGYVAFAGELWGAGRLRGLVARIEDRMLRDRSSARGWYVEVGPTTDAGPFLAVGFREIPVDYRQPCADGPGLPVRLMYKPFGRAYQPVVLSAAEVSDDVEQIMATVYGVDGTVRASGT